MKFTKAINEAMFESMSLDNKVICYGLGVDDPKRIFGTTEMLRECFGGERVFDMPTSENGMTGVGIGVAMGGYRPVMVHQRLDFFLLSMDQLVNAAAKWYYMFGGQVNIPIVIRLIVGRGWGQGPTHSQSLHAWFSHIPGLKVVMPSNAADAKGLLMTSIFDGNPILFIEHRWLHDQDGVVPTGDYRVPLGEAKILRKGNDITIVAFSFMTIEALHVVDYLQKKNINCELIDLRTIQPIDWATIIKSVNKTGKILVLDFASRFGSVAGEIVAEIAEKCFDNLKSPPMRVCLPDHATPTSFGLTKDFYPSANEIVNAIEKLLGYDVDKEMLLSNITWPHDVPGDWFKGPF